MNVSIRELKNRLLECLQRMQAGEDVVITLDGKPIAHLVPVPGTSADPETGAITRLRAQPWVRPGNGGKPYGYDARIPTRTAGKTIAEIIGEKI